jgi:hypothetical protein
MNMNKIQEEEEEDLISQSTTDNKNTVTKKYTLKEITNKPIKHIILNEKIEKIEKIRKIEKKTFNNILGD